MNHQAWPDGPWLVVTGVVLAAVATWYARGTRVLRQRGAAPHAQRWRSVACGAGAAVTVVVALPPVARLGEGRLVGHMVAQMALITVAAPLLAWGAPGRALRAGLPRRVGALIDRALLARRSAPAVPGSPLLAAAVAWVVHVATVWVWHLPAAHDATLRVPALRAAEYALFLGTAWWFWWYVLAPSPRRLNPPLAAAYLALATLPSAALGAVLTFSPVPLYASHMQAAGPGALADQQLAGMIMWIPADLAYVLVALTLFWRWFSRGIGPAVLPPEPPHVRPVGTQTLGTHGEGVRR